MVGLRVGSAVPRLLVHVVALVSTAIVACVAMLVSAPVSAQASSTNVFAWGSNGNGTGAQFAGALGAGLADCTTAPAQSNVPVPVAIPAGEQINSVYAGLNRGYALAPSARVLVWGDTGTGTDNPMGLDAADACDPYAANIPNIAGDGTQEQISDVAPTVAGTIYDDSLSNNDDNGENFPASSVGTDLKGELMHGGGDTSIPTARGTVPGEVPTPAPGAQQPARQIVSGDETTLFLTQSGEVTAWGGDEYGELGDGGAHGTAGYAGGVQVVLGVTGQQVAAGPYYDLALGSDGNVYGWGEDDTDQLGPNPTTAGTTSPTGVVEIPFPQRIVQIAAGGDPGIGDGSTADGFGLALGADGTLYAWGADGHGQLANGTISNTPVATPRAITDLPSGVTITQIAAGSQQGFALGSNGTLYSWGGGQYGMLGRGTTSDSATPGAVQFPSGTQVQSVGAQADAYAVYAAATAQTFVSATTVTNITNTSATFTSAVYVPEGTDLTGASCGFVVTKTHGNEFGPVEEAAPCSLTAGAPAQFSLTDQSLSPGEDESAQAYVGLSSGDYQGPTANYVTTAPPPPVTTGTATNITTTSAQLSGSFLVPEGEDALIGDNTCEFQYAPAGSGAFTTVPGTVIDPEENNLCINGGALATPLQAVLTGLTPGTTYYYRAVIVNQSGALTSPDDGPLVSFTTNSNAPPAPPVPPAPPAPSPPPPSGPPGPGPAPQPPSGSQLSQTTCSIQTRSISAAGGTFEVTGCIYGDNEHHYVVEGRLTLNGLTLSATGTPQPGSPPTFSCATDDTACGALARTYSSSRKPEFAIDVQNDKIAGNTTYSIATGSSTVFSGSIQSPGASGTGATFNPTATGLPAGSGPAIDLQASSGFASLHGFAISGPITILPDGGSERDGGSEITMTLATPFPGLNGAATLGVGSDGSEDLRALSVDIADLSIPGTPIDLGEVSFSYDLDTNSWSAMAELPIPGLYAVGGESADTRARSEGGEGEEANRYKLAVTVVISAGKLQSLEGGISGLEIPLTEALTLDKIELGFGLSPITVMGSIGLDAGPKIGELSLLHLDADFKLAFDAPATIGPILDVVPETDVSDVPVTFELDGSLTLAGGIPFGVPLGSATMDLYTGGGFSTVITFTGGLGANGQGLNLTVGGYNLASIQANLGGIVSENGFDAGASGSVSVLGENLASGQFLISDQGVALCAQLPGLGSLARDASASGAPRQSGPEATAAGAGGRSGQEATAASAFAESAVAAAHPFALSKLSPAQKRKRVKQLAHALQQIAAQIQQLKASTKRKVAAIEAADRTRSHAAAVAAIPAVRAMFERYAHGRSTAVQLSGQLTAHAAATAGALRAAGAGASSQLTALRSSTESTMRSLAQRGATDLAELHTLQSTAGAAGDPIATEACDPFSSSCYTELGNDLESAGDDLGGYLEQGYDYASGYLEQAYEYTAQQADEAEQAAVQAAEETYQNLQEGISEAGSGIAYLEDSLVEYTRDVASAADTFVQQVDDLGTLAGSELEAAADAAAAGIVEVYDDVEEALNGSIGVGWDWGDTPTIYPTGGCDVGNFADTNVVPSSDAELASSSPRVRARVAQATTFTLTGGTQFTVLRFAGDGAPPLVSVQGPGGLSLTTPTSTYVSIEDNGQAVVIRDPTSNTTFVQFPTQAGSYTTGLEPGSVAVTSSGQASSLPEPTVTATVTGHGTRRVLHWKTSTAPGQTLTFTLSDGSTPQTITTTSAATGSAPFTVVAGLPGLDTVSAQVQDDGFTQTDTGFQVVSFQAPVAPPPAKPRELKITRRGETVRVSWTPSAAAAGGYSVQVQTTGGVRENLTVDAPPVTLSAVVPADSVAAQVGAIDADGDRSAPAIASSAGKAMSGCLAPIKYKVVLQARRKLTGAYATLNGTPVAETTTSSDTLAVSLAGITTKRATLVVHGTVGGRTVTGRHVFTLCSGLIVKPLKLKLR